MNNQERKESEKLPETANPGGISNVVQSQKTEEAEKALNKAVEEAIFAAIELVKNRISQKGVSPDSSTGIQEAMKLAVDLVKQEITLALGAIVFSGTLLKNSSYTSTKWLYLSWGAWFLSILLGLIAMGRITTVVSEERYSRMDSGLGKVAMGQQFALLLGIICFGIFAMSG
jgi:hypothetical protein